jgi:malic enzyme
MYEGKKAWMHNYPKDYLMTENTNDNNSLALHERFQGVIKTASKIKMKDMRTLYNLIDKCYYDQIEEEIINEPKMVKELTFKGNWAAIITNGTAVLGFGDITAAAGMPVMEGKSCLFKQLGGVDVVPMCIQEKDPKKLIEIIARIAPIFSAINLEDIKAPECFEVEEALIERLDIPVFHDDQHGTAIVVTAACINSFKLMEKKAD